MRTILSELEERNSAVDREFQDVLPQLNSAASSTEFLAAHLQVVALLYRHEENYSSAADQLEELNWSAIATPRTIRFRISSYRELAQLWGEAATRLELGDITALRDISVRGPQLLIELAQREDEILCAEVTDAGISRELATTCN